MSSNRSASPETRSSRYSTGQALSKPIQVWQPFQGKGAFPFPSEPWQPGESDGRGAGLHRIPGAPDEECVLEELVYGRANDERRGLPGHSVPRWKDLVKLLIQTDGERPRFEP